MQTLRSHPLPKIETRKKRKISKQDFVKLANEVAKIMESEDEKLKKEKETVNGNNYPLRFL